MGGADASGEGAEQCLLPESKPTRPGGGALDEEGMTPAQKAQEKVTRAFREQVRVRVVFAVPSLRTPTASSAGKPYMRQSLPTAAAATAAALPLLAPIYIKPNRALAPGSTPPTTLPTAAAAAATADWWLLLLPRCRAVNTLH